MASLLCEDLRSELQELTHADIELAKGKQRAKWKEEFERQLDATEAAVLERDETIAKLKAEVKQLKKGAYHTKSTCVGGLGGISIASDATMWTRVSHEKMRCDRR